MRVSSRTCWSVNKCRRFHPCETRAAASKISLRAYEALVGQVGVPGTEILCVMHFGLTKLDSPNALWKTPESEVGAERIQAHRETMVSVCGHLGSETPFVGVRMDLTTTRALAPPLLIRAQGTPTGGAKVADKCDANSQRNPKARQQSWQSPQKTAAVLLCCNRPDDCGRNQQRKHN